MLPHMLVICGPQHTGRRWRKEKRNSLSSNLQVFLPSHTEVIQWVLLDMPGVNSPCIEKSGAQDHDSFTCALFELHLDGTELAMDDADHPLYLLGWDGPGPALLSQQIHHVSGELVACLGQQEKEREDPLGPEESLLAVQEAAAAGM